MQKQLAIVEAFAVPEIHFDGLHSIVVAGSKVWFLPYINQPSVISAGAIERVLAARIVCDVTIVPGFIAQTIAAVGKQIVCSGRIGLH